MNDKFFLDTNLLIYSFDAEEPEKQKIANGLIRDALKTRLGIISYRVIQEFLNVATQKWAQPLTTIDAKEYLEKSLMPLCEVLPSQALFQNALDIKASTNFSFYDSNIIAAAIQGQCKFLFSEDLNDGQIIETVQIKNPFK